MFDKIKDLTWELKYCGVKYTVKEKTKNKIDDIKDHPGKTAAKLGVNVIVNTVIPAGRIINPTVKYTAKKVIDKVCDK